MPLTSDWYDIVPQVIYDSEPLGPGPQLMLYVNPIGSLTPNHPELRKTQRDTNMWMQRMLPAPQRFLITGIRCVYLEPSGEVVPVTDACYWDTILEFDVSSKMYWQSPVALCVDPMILTTPAQWEDMSFDRRKRLMERFGQHSMCAEIRPDQILIGGMPELISGKAKVDGIKIEGILIEQQQMFGVRINHSGEWPKRRIVCCLDGRMARPIL